MQAGVNACLPQACRALDHSFIVLMKVASSVHIFIFGGPSSENSSHTRNSNESGACQLDDLSIHPASDATIYPVDYRMEGAS